MKLLHKNNIVFLIVISLFVLLAGSVLLGVGIKDVTDASSGYHYFYVKIYWHNNPLYDSNDMPYLSYATLSTGKYKNTIGDTLSCRIGSAKTETINHTDNEKENTEATFF